MDRRLNELIHDWDAAIRYGQGRDVRRGLEALFRELKRDPRNPIERRYLADLAALCRRTGLPEGGVRLLSPIVRPKARDVHEATAHEKAEYAAALNAIGADLEARELLDAVDSKKFPRSLFFGALARFSRWDYSGAIPLLESYVASPGITEYERRIGEVNLIAARVAIGHEGASHTIPSNEAKTSIRATLEALLAKTAEEGLRLLHGNLLEIQAQHLIASRKFPEARASLEKSRELLKEIGSSDFLFVEKWRAVLELRESGGGAHALAKLFDVRGEALRADDWETVRDCDYQVSLLKDRGASHNTSSKDARSFGHRTRSEIISHLYFGTPHESYRHRITSECGFTPGESYDWDVREAVTSRNSKTGAKLIDPHRAEGLKPGQVPQRLLHILASDFYRPHRLAAIHATLFPERHYNPETSPAVVHQAIKRLRAWCEEQGHELEVIETKGMYRLTGQVRLRTYSSMPSLDRAEVKAKLWLKDLREYFIDRPALSFRQIAERTPGESPRSVHRLVAQALDSGHLVREGAGKRTRYRLPRERSSREV